MRRVRWIGCATVLAAALGFAACGASDGDRSLVDLVPHDIGGSAGVGGIATSGGPPQAGAAPSFPVCVTDATRSFTQRLSATYIDAALDALFGPGPQIATAIAGLDRAYARDTSESFVAALYDVAVARAKAAVTDDAVFEVCAVEDTSAAKCVQPWLRDWGGKLYRRPLSDEQLSGYIAQFRGIIRDHSSSEAARLALISMLLSPYFALRIELGSAQFNGTLDAYEVAARLSHFALRGAPDAELTASAASGALNDANEVLVQLRRLTQTPTGRAARELQYREWLGVPNVSARADLDADLSADMLEQFRLLVTDVLDDQDATLETLLTTSEQPLNQRLATHLGVAKPLKDGFQNVSLEPTLFAGLLSTGAFLSTYPRPSSRGRRINLALLCVNGPPEPAQGHSDVALGEGTSPRQRLAASAGATPACNVCHKQFDPVGLALDAFDDQGRPTGFDSSGSVSLTSNMVPIDVAVANPSMLGKAIADSLQGRTCAARRYLEYALDRGLSDTLVSDVKTIQGNPDGSSPPLPIVREDPDFALLDCLVRQGYTNDFNLTDLAEALVTSVAFRSRSGSVRRVTPVDNSLDPFEHAAQETVQFHDAFPEALDVALLERYASSLRAVALRQQDHPPLGNGGAAGEGGAGGDAAAGAPHATGGAP
jgi:hypothetical protein